MGEGGGAARIFFCRFSSRFEDICRKEVATLVNVELHPGNHETTFDGNGLARGVYLYRIQAGDFVQTRKLVFLR